jgi:hypothetical protein
VSSGTLHRRTGAQQEHCPIDACLDRLKSSARKGDVQAVRRIRAIAKSCREFLNELPPEVTAKKPSVSTSTNALAAQLLSLVKLVRNNGRGSSELDCQIKALLPLAPETFLDWWRCAWALTKDQNFCDVEMVALIDEIGLKAPSVQKKFEARKSKLIEIAKLEKKLPPGLTLQNDRMLVKKFTKQGKIMIKEWRRYVENQTRKAARRVWFETQN